MAAASPAFYRRFPSRLLVWRLLFHNRHGPRPWRGPSPRRSVLHRLLCWYRAWLRLLVCGICFGHAGGPKRTAPVLPRNRHFCGGEGKIKAVSSLGANWKTPEQNSKVLADSGRSFFCPAESWRCNAHCRASSCCPVSSFPICGGGSLTAAQKMPSCLTAFMNSAKSTGFTT